MREQYKLTTTSWQTQYDNREPRTEMDDLLEKIRYFRWELDLTHEDPNYTLDELKIKYVEMKGGEDEE